MRLLPRLLLLPAAAMGLLAAGCACPHAGPHAPPPGHGPRAGMYRDGPGKGPPMARERPPISRDGRRAWKREARRMERGRPGMEGPRMSMGPGPMRDRGRMNEGPMDRGPSDDRMAEVHQALRRSMERIERLEVAVREGGPRGGRPGADGPRREGNPREVNPEGVRPEEVRRAADEMRGELERREGRIHELELQTRKLEEMLQRLKGELRDREERRKEK